MGFCTRFNKTLANSRRRMLHSWCEKCNIDDVRKCDDPGEHQWVTLNLENHHIERVKDISYCLECKTRLENTHEVRAHFGTDQICTGWCDKGVKGRLQEQVHGRRLPMGAFNGICPWQAHSSDEVP